MLPSVGTPYRVRLSVVRLSVVRLSVVRLSVVRLSVNRSHTLLEYKKKKSNVNLVLSDMPNGADAHIQEAYAIDLQIHTQGMGWLRIHI